MVSLFKDRSPIAIIWLFLLCIAVHSSFVFSPPAVLQSDNNGLLSVFLNKFCLGLSPILLICIYHVCVLVQAFWLNAILSNFHMYGRVNYFPAMVYILLTGVFLEWNNLSPSLLINTLIIGLYAKTLQLYNHPNPKTLIFNMGLLVGIIILLYHPLALLIIAALFAVMIIRTFNPSEWIVLLLGIATPFYFSFSYLFLFDRWSSYSDYIPHWQFNLPDIHINNVFFITVGLLFLVLIIGLYYWQQENRKLLIQVRKNWGLLITLFFILLLVPFINKGSSLDSFLLWIVPASPLIAKGFFVPSNNRLPNIMFWLLFALILLKNWQIIHS